MGGGVRIDLEVLRATGQHLERRDDDLGLAMSLSGVVVPLARLEVPVDVDQLALAQVQVAD